MPITVLNADKLPKVADTVDKAHLEHKGSYFTLDFSIPKHPSLPVSKTGEFWELQGRLSRGEISMFEYAMRTFCIFSHRTRDSVTMEELETLPFPPGIEGEGEKMAMLRSITGVVNELVNALDLRIQEGNAAPPEPKAKRVKAETKN